RRRLLLRPARAGGRADVLRTRRARRSRALVRADEAGDGDVHARLLDDADADGLRRADVDEPGDGRLTAGMDDLATLGHRLRPARGDARGALVLLHGRGADEHDLYPLFDQLDPDRSLLGVTVRGPLALPPGGAHWYVVHEIGRPDP